MQLRLPTVPEALLQVLFLLIVAVLVADYFDAASAQCHPPKDHRGWCNLWGATAGPAGEYWNYRSRDVYLRVSLATIAAFAIPIAIPFVVRRRWMAILGMFVALFAGLALVNPQTLG
jgi:hypothetical protein